MLSILVATDSAVVLSELQSLLGGSGVEFMRVREGRQVREAVITHEPDVIILDMQIGSMGGIAAAIDLRLEESGERLDEQRIILLLDRTVDEFLGTKSGADALVVKPLDARRMRAALDAVLEDRPWTDPILERVASQESVGA